MSSDLPRLLVIMGSGETAPTMIKPHRAVFDRLGDDVKAVLLDTPFGFQENAPILAEKAVEYFGDSVGREVDVAHLQRTDTGDTAAIESAVAGVRRADWVFAGPGSPSFALRQWRGTGVPEALAAKLRTGGAVVFSSAAALTLGIATVPVYEIYKVGVEPYWDEGLDLLGPLGLSVAVIPHYDNTEGGNHDTRFCYLGERRLAQLEPELPDDAFVLGVDEHTGLVIDLDSEDVDIIGRGGVTIRDRGESIRFEAGTTITLEVLRSRGRADAGDRFSQPAPAEPSEAETGGENAPAMDAAAASLSLADDTVACEALFEEAIGQRDAAGAITAVLRLEEAIVSWSRDTLQSDEADRARAALRAMIARLGDVAVAGLQDPREVVGPVVEAALDARRTARSEGAYAVSDAIRDGLIGVGVEIRDTADGTEWDLVP